MSTTTTANTTSTPTETAVGIPKITYTKTKNIPYARSLPEFLELTHKKEPIAYRVAPQDQSLPAFTKWNEQFFASSVIPVAAHRCTSIRMFDIVHNSIRELIQSAMKHNFTIGEYIKKQQQHRMQSPNHPIGSFLLSGTEMYLRHQFADRPHFQELMPDLDNLQQFIPIPKDDIRTIGLWMSGKGLSSQTHFDSSGDHNMNFQICGSKLCTLYEPIDGIRNLYPLPVRACNLSLVDPYHPDVLQQFPRVQLATPHVIELKAGDILFIPALWWHDIRHLGEFNINLTAWYPEEKRGPMRLAEGPAFFDNWTDTLVAWFYLLKIAVACIMVRVIAVVTNLEPYEPEVNEDRKKHD